MYILEHPDDENMRRTSFNTTRGGGNNRNVSRNTPTRVLKTEPAESEVNPRKRSETPEKGMSLANKQVNNVRNEEELKALRREKAIKIIHKAIIVVQRAFRRYLQRKKDRKNSLTLSLSVMRDRSKSPRLERENNLIQAKVLLTERKNDTTSN